MNNTCYLCEQDFPIDGTIDLRTICPACGGCGYWCGREHGECWECTHVGAYQRKELTMTERSIDDKPYRTPAYLVIWDVLYRDGQVSRSRRHAFCRTEIETREMIGRLKQPVSTWRSGDTVVLGDGGVLTDRGTHIEVYVLPVARGINPDDVPVGWTAEKANAGEYSK